jgi:DNA-directed RNA polymerase specialized sigma24 family protein
MTDKGDTILDGITKENLIEIYRDLVAYADYLLSIYGVWYDTQGINAHDFASSVIMKVLDVDSDDHRKWNPSKNPDIVRFFKGCISSEISNHLVSKRFQTTADNTLKLDYDFFDSLGKDNTITEQFDTAIIQEQLLNTLIEENEELAEILLYLVDEYSIEEIAELMDYESTRKVYYARDKIRNITIQVLNKLGKEKI